MSKSSKSKINAKYLKKSKKKVSKSSNKLSLLDSLLKYKLQLIVFLLISVLIGSVHGFYMSYLNEKKLAILFGSSLCNGQMEEGFLEIGKSDSYINLYYQTIIKTGKVNFELYDSNGKIISEFHDWNSLLRQKIIRLDKVSLGKYKYSLYCDKADIKYDIRIEVK